MQVKKFIRDYLSFNRKERLGLLSLFGLILIIYLLPGFLKKEKSFDLKEVNFLARRTDSMDLKQNHLEEPENQSIYSHYEPSRSKSFKQGELFRFDPNSLDADGWKRLGLSEKTTKTILNYTSKGGRFRTADDLKKIWGIPEGFFERVKVYIEIRDEAKVKVEIERKEFSKPERISLLININDADTTAWINLPGIGSKLASRIISFRNKLGGFYSIEQLKETFGLQDSVFQKIKPFLQISGDVKKININTATKEDLKTHPYIKWNIANAIVEYRNQHGSFQSMNDLKKVSLVTEEVVGKLQAYLEF